MSRIRQFFFVLLFALLPLVVHAAEPINVNTADAQSLATALRGIGQSKAEAIVAYREANGPFKSADDLLKIKGIGQKTVDTNRDLIRVE
jgi:competence protein ComEA